MTEATKKGAYAKLIGIDPEIIQVLLLSPLQRILLFSSLARQIQPDIVKVHLACSAGDCRVAPGTQANRNLVHVSQDYALIGKSLQRNDPLGPCVDVRRGRIVVYHYRRLSGSGGYGHK